MPNSDRSSHSSSGAAAGLPKAALALTVGNGLAVAAALGAANQQSSALYLVAGLMAAWAVGVGIIQFFFFWIEKGDAARAEDDIKSLPPYQGGWQFGLLLILGVLVGAWLGEALKNPFLPADEEGSTVRVQAILLAAAGFAIFVLAKFASVAARDSVDRLRPLLRLSWLNCISQFAASVALLIFVYSGYQLAAFVGWAISVAIILLIAEAAVLAVAYFYQPAKDRSQEPVGNSMLLGWIGGRGNPLRVLSANLESSYGVRLQDTWVAQFFSRAFEPLLLAAVMVLWLSTSMTVVPVESQGVKVRFGKFAQEPVGPGLHFTLPWPMEHIHLVETKRIRSLEIGYGKDLGREVLWDVRHYEDEQNMLVGNGDELLTVNVPIYYRIKDPVTYLLNTRDPKNAVSRLAARALVRSMATRESFAIMISERDGIRAEIHDVLQKEVDRLNLGLEITFVGLKDIHPPVAVAPAYQDVISAREDRLTYGLEGQTFRARRLPETQGDAFRLLQEADAFGVDRIARAVGDTQRFELVQAAQKDEPQLFRTRNLLDRLEQTLSAVPKIVLDSKASAAGSSYVLDLRRLQRDPGTAPTTATPALEPIFTPEADENRPPAGMGGFEDTGDLALPQPEPSPAGGDLELPQ